MAADNTIIDAPVTPAPVFAYRALRGIFFGSPDDSTLANDAIIQPSIKPESSTVPNDHCILSNVKLTPSQKRKRDSNTILSPTKSCLRAPGVVTPRRAMLRDITVTFKDPRKSISPELSMKIAKVEKSNISDNKENETIAAPKLPSIKPNSTTTKSPVKPVRAVTTIPSPPVSIRQGSTVKHMTDSTFDAQSYMATTEKEMKKLIRYSQKMRDYARRQDEENMKLKELIEELKKENVRLKKSANIHPEIQHKKRRPGPEQFNQRRTLSSIPSVSVTEPKNQENTVDEPKALGIQQPKPQSKTYEFDLDDLLNLDSKIPPQTASHKNTVNTTKPSAEAIKPHRSHSDSNQATNSSKRTQPPVSQQILPLRSTHTFNPASTGPDRMAAARERVRKRAELRKASATLITNVPKSENELIPEHSETGTKNESVLDWEGL